jgi:hypothetical protein
MKQLTVLNRFCFILRIFDIVVAYESSTMNHLMDVSRGLLEMKINYFFEILISEMDALSQNRRTCCSRAAGQSALDSRINKACEFFRN